jgi:hypothetical protein
MEGVPFFFSKFVQRMSPLLALNAIRCGAQNSAAIGDTADITGLEAARGSIENDPLRKSGGPKCCDAQHGFLIMW